MNSPSQSENPDPDSTPLQHRHFSQFENPISFDHPNNTQSLEILTIQNPQKPDPTRLIADQEEQEEEEEYSGMVQKSTAKLPNRRKYNKRRLAFVNQKQRAIDKKVQNLFQLGTLIPFVPLKRFDFDKHEVLLKRLGLWDFVHVEFDEVIRDDLVAQFIVSYDVVKKCCFVNGVRVNVNRSKFASVLKLPSPMKKDKVVGSVAEAAIDVDLEKVSEECIEFVEDFVWSWVVLHGGDWVMPNEVEIWMGLIRDGLPEKVDWAKLIWVMAENELKQRDQLRMCYYASHMQYFMKSQRRDLFDEESEDVAVNEETKEEEKALSEEDITKVKVDGKVKDKDLLEEAEKVDEVGMDGINLLKERPHEEVEEVKKGPHEEVAVKVEGVKKDAVGSFYDLIKEQDKSVLEEPNIRLTLGQQDIAQNEEIKDDTRMAVGKCPVTKCGHQYSFGYEKEGKHFLKPCIFGEGRGSDGNEEIKQEVGQLETEEEEHMEEREHMEAEDVEESKGDEMMDQLEAEYEDEEEEEEELEDTIECNIVPNYGKQEVGQLETEEEEYMEEGEHMEAEDVEESEGDEMMDQVEAEEEDEDEDEDEEEEELEDTIECNIAPNYGSVQGADLTGVLQGFKTTHLPLNLQGQQLNENSSMELFASNAEKQPMIGCPSMAGNGHKRGIVYEQDTSHLDGSKRIRTDVGWDHNASDFRFCMGQVRQYIEKAKIIYEEKDRAYNQLNVNQQYFLQELQQRDSIIENLQRNKNEELHKKDEEIYRLERELDLLGELVNGYREALKVNRNIFYEYRQQCRLPEEPIYKDAGSGGLVLSTTDLEKQRQQQEKEDRLKRLMIEQTYTEALEGYVKQFQALFSKVQMIDVNRLTPVVNEVKLLKELHAARHRAPEIPDCMPTETTLPSA